ncbi:MAG: CCA tRNA nucleotidyltransferase [Candidatus Micrarchaeota archaeon]|nr:CCA tRNA nucleotidyltransferase [Candidatus Micrarchaeota archaeon]
MKCANPKQADNIFAVALKKIKPSFSETTKDFEAANILIRKLERAVPSSVEVRLAGSLAKGTNLAGKNEFDIFILFPRNYHHHEMCMLGLNYARRAFHGMRMESRYAEHPYLQVFSGDYHADIVPAYKISQISERGSSVDRSVMHTEYINSKLNAAQKEQVRLLKTFMKNFGIYGAELRVEGFSGYLCELLIVQYGSLLKLMEEAAGWDAPALDVANHHRGTDLRKIFDSPLVLIDPVDPKRNVAAVVAYTSLSRFIFECRRFLKNPSDRFFFSKKDVRSAAEIRTMMKRRGTKLLALTFPAPKVVADVLWPQLRKTEQALVRYLESLDFSVFGYYRWSDGKECVIMLELDQWKLPNVRKAAGPKIKFAKDMDSFVQKHSESLNLHLEQDHIVAVERRECVYAALALLSACRHTTGLGVPEHMARQIVKAKLLHDSDIVRGKYAEFLSDYFFARIA